MPFEKIQPKKIYEEVADTIEKMIVDHTLCAGDRLDSVEKLAENFSVSRSAIREALSALKAKGLIDIRQGEGSFVKTFDATKLLFPIHNAVLMKKEDIEHLLEMRQMIEVGSASSAAKHRTDADLLTMQQILNSMQRSLKEEHGFGERDDLAFHTAIAKATHNPLLVTFLQQVADVMIETIRETRKLYLYTDKETMHALYNEHLAIFQAIERQDTLAAQQAMQLHLSNVEQLLLTAFIDEEVL